MVADEPRLAEDMKRIGVPENRIAHYADVLDSQAIKQINAGGSQIHRQTTAMTNKYLAELNFYDMLIRNEGHWSFNSGKFVFEGQERLDEFNHLLQADAKAISEMAAMQKDIQETQDRNIAALAGQRP